MSDSLLPICVSKTRGVGTFYSIGVFSFVGTSRANGPFVREVLRLWKVPSCKKAPFGEKNACKIVGTFIE